MKLSTIRRVLRSMLKRGLFVILSVSLIGGAARAANSPFVGEWKLDLSRTKLADQMTVENVSGDKYAFDFGGGAETIVVDGTEQPGVGDTTLSVAVEGPDSWKVVRKKDGRVMITAIWKLSKDGRTLTDEFTTVASDGSSSTVPYLYERTAGTSGFAGTWESANMSASSVFVLEIKPYEEDGLSLIYPSQGVTRNVKFDGKDYPIVSAYLPTGSTSSARLVDRQTVEMTDKSKGAILDTRQMKVSSDRKTLTVTVRTPRLRHPSILVFERQ